MSFNVPPSLTVGTTIERSFSSSSLRSPAKNSASPSRTPQKSFGRLPARVAAAPVSPVIATPAPVVAESEEISNLPLSVDDTHFTLDFEQENAQDLQEKEEVNQEHEDNKLHVELDVLRQELRDLREASSKVIKVLVLNRIQYGLTQVSCR
ncbi:hypothetical protein P3T76_006442 [Phytophthora citrophthora]|uniref:Uncharacterized protein n=1 Tax=Phytophthora citrophthora TaxID=4793 RepID=A0AAD9GPB2_9STRA|nr:hypothetical protein P3T76_006442 [Phytophthora citrophthora]